MKSGAANLKRNRATRPLASHDASIHETNTLSTNDTVPLAESLIHIFYISRKYVGIWIFLRSFIIIGTGEIWTFSNDIALVSLCLKREHTRCVCLGSVARRGQKIIRVIKIILKIKRLVCVSWMGAVAVVDVIAVVVAIIILSFSALAQFLCLSFGKFVAQLCGCLKDSFAHRSSEVDNDYTSIIIMRMTENGYERWECIYNNLCDANRQREIERATEEEKKM